MRACVVTADLGTIGSRRDGWRRRIIELAGRESVDEVCYVGLRQTGPLEDGTAAYVPHVEAEQYTNARLANSLLRLVDARLAPRSIARIALSRWAPAVVETILATDPDVVLLDVRWGRYVKTLLEADFGGPIWVSGEPPPSDRADLQWGNGDPSAKVSIVLPTHNGSKYIRQSIRSCLEQSHRNLELIVVDDGSTEAMGAIVAEFTDPRVHYVRHERNQGLPAALNTGFRLCSGAYLTWTSDDNFYAPGAIERLVRFLQRYPSIAFVYSSAYIIDEIAPGQRLRIQRAQPAVDLKHRNGVGACFLYTRQVYADVGDYDSGATLVEDYDYWVRVSKQFRMQRLFTPLYYYRYHNDSLTTKHGPDDVAKRFDLVRRQNGMA